MVSAVIGPLPNCDENAWWVAKQMGHVDVEMVFRHYGKWIPKDKTQHQTVNDWSDSGQAKVA